MKKVITKITCDDCVQELPENYKGLFFPGTNIDLCIDCINIRLKYSFIKYPIEFIKCLKCKGKGRYQQWDGPNNGDTHTEKCEFCKETGRRDLI